MNIFLTGSTGFLGGELLINLSKRSEINKIYCLIRAASIAEATLRLEHVFHLHDDFFDKNKVIPIIGDLFDDQLTELLIGNKTLQNNVEVIIHCAANTSFSRIYDDMVEKANIGGLNKILLWAKQLPQLCTFLYIGTATICGKDIKNREVTEEESPNLLATHLVKYTYTKMQGEILLHQHLPKEKILIARPSIIMGDSRPLIPRSTVILWALATINELRLIPVNQHAALDIIPVDYAARAIVGLLFTKRNYSVYHISSGKTAATTLFKLTNTIANHSNQKPPFHFVDKSMLSQVKNWAKHNLKLDSPLHSYTEYLEYWEKNFLEASKLRILIAGMDPYFEFIELGQVFDNSRLLNDLSIDNSEPADIYLNNCINFLESIDIFEGALDS
jgi:thioester reductase-like protein